MQGCFTHHYFDVHVEILASLAEPVITTVASVLPVKLRKCADRCSSVVSKAAKLKLKTELSDKRTLYIDGRP
jgi:hypothetical protein